MADEVIRRVSAWAGWREIRPVFQRVPNFRTVLWIALSEQYQSWGRQKISPAL